MSHKFERFERLIGKNALEYLNNKSVLILGCGGVGSYVADSLARSNIGTLILVDPDTIDVSNINRQIMAFSSTVGKKKTSVLKQRIKDINSTCQIITINKFINEENIAELFLNKIDYLVDACDTVSTKQQVILACLEKNIPFISSMGTGNKFNPEDLYITDLKNTINDPLARVMRKFIKTKKIKEKVIVLSSKEVPLKTSQRTPGSTSFVPSSAGLMIASYVVKYFLNELNTPKEKNHN